MKMRKKIQAMTMTMTKTKMMIKMMKMRTRMIKMTRKIKMGIRTKTNNKMKMGKSRKMKSLNSQCLPLESLSLLKLKSLNLETCWQTSPLLGLPSIISSIPSLQEAVLITEVTNQESNPWYQRLSNSIFHHHLNLHQKKNTLS